ncbi:GDSL esterase/lipase 5 [Acorus gramineus]|uniref:GDSL esterase/lipase 5 n=1 Tax=Acorus gramineus TaxID=55184 RepID=A0AAV9AFQ2_ACOGR|nr:GDSL esterase/lipase 5 [Acorus gramineus]
MLIPNYSLLIAIQTLFFLSVGARLLESPPEKPPVARRALFIFGDSTVDIGNNNYIETVPGNRADYPPYGRNGFFDGPTGRFSDGRVIVDFFAEYARLPTIPPFMQPCIQLHDGVNFASGGAGVLPETNEGKAIDLHKQLNNFKAVQRALSKELGNAKAKDLIQNSVCFFSIGSNDYMGGYLGSPVMRNAFSPEEFVAMVLGNLTQAIQTIYEMGGKRFGFLSLPPLGCLPGTRLANSNNTVGGGCLEKASMLAMAHNNALSTTLTSLAHILSDFKYANSNFYEWLQDRIRSPSEYGFDESLSACCGTGPYRGLFTCGKAKHYELCETSDAYVWWDSYHFTERIDEQFARELWNGSSVGPFSMEELFFSDGGKEITMDGIIGDA